jgi:D-inositol-3-phosphate glycosyltransferase
MSQRVAVESMVMQTAERLIAATHAERVQMLLLYRADRRRIEVVPPGVDLQRFHPIDRQQAKYMIGLDTHNRLLLSVGRIERLKGIDVVCQALAILKDRCPEEMAEVKYYVIGGDLDGNSSDNDELQHLQELCASLGLEEMIKFVGAKGHEELLDYYNAADALVMPSDYESFGMVALEAMACGTPVIASEVGGLAFLVNDGVTGYHVPTREPEALAERIFWLLTDNHAWQQMSQAAHQSATTYSWNRIADKLMEIFIDATLEKATHPHTL